MDVEEEEAPSQPAQQSKSAAKRARREAERKAAESSRPPEEPALATTLPGDDVTGVLTKKGSNLRLGPGLLQQGAKVVAVRSGSLRFRAPQTCWVDANQKRYRPRVGDQVVGIVEDRLGECVRLNIFGSSPALLDLLAFEGASKRNRPNLRPGCLVYARVVTADRDMDPELSCVTAHHGLKKDWVTNQGTYGELKGGTLVRCSLMYARSLVKPRCVVLNCLGKRAAFEVAIGANGAVWVNSGSVALTVAVSNAILNAEVMNEAQTEVMVERVMQQIERSSS